MKSKIFFILLLSLVFTSISFSEHIRQKLDDEYVEYGTIYIWGYTGSTVIGPVMASGYIVITPDIHVWDGVEGAIWVTITVTNNSTNTVVSSETYGVSATTPWTNSYSVYGGSTAEYTVAYSSPGLAIQGSIAAEVCR